MNKKFFLKKKNDGGLTFMVNDKMCVGVVKENLMACIDPEIYEAALTKKGEGKLILPADQ